MIFLAAESMIDMPEWVWTAVSGIAGTLIIGFILRYVQQIDKKAANVDIDIKALQVALAAHEREDVERYADLRVMIISGRDGDGK